MASLFRVPVAERIDNAQRILVAGAGGGFDVFAGLPLFLTLLRAGKVVSLANLSFTALEDTNALRTGPACWEVGPRTVGPTGYFPEKYLAEWLASRGLPSTIYCFDKVGVRLLREEYAALVRDLALDAIQLVDGGTDILMRGDEFGLGTPVEDMTSLAAVNALDVSIKIVTCLGFGVDSYHGVCHAHFLENVAALEAVGSYLGTHSLHLSMPEVAQFRDAVEYVHARMPVRPSIVNGSILSALEGQFGDYHRTDRTRSSTLFINPLMTHYWHFDLAAVAARNLYLPLLETTDTPFQVQAIIEAFRKTVHTREHRTIPV